MLDALQRDRAELSQRSIGPINVVVTSRIRALALVHQAIHQKAGIIAFCNAHSVNLARRDAGLANALDIATVFNDGIGVNLASRFLYGSPFPTNLNGTDLTPAVLENSPRPLRLFLLGSRPGVAARAGKVLQARFPHHSVVGCHHGFITAEDDVAVFEMIRDAQPDLILVGMGQPYQELWASRHCAGVGAAIMCVGAFLDFTAGEVRRAPRWVRSARLEWAFRLAREPRRLSRRYLTGNLLFLINIVRDKFKLGRSRLS